MGILDRVSRAFDPPQNKVARQLEGPDHFNPGAPLAPEAPANVVQPQRIGGISWQQQKLIEDERRLDAVAKRAANKQMAVAAANPQNFKRGTLDADGNFVPYEDDDPRNVIDRTVPAPHVIDPILQDIEARSSHTDHEVAHVPERLTEAERAKRDAANPLPSEVTVYLKGNFTITDVRAKLVAAGADLTKGQFAIRPHLSLIHI